MTISWPSFLSLTLAHSNSISSLSEPLFSSSQEQDVFFSFLPRGDETHGFLCLELSLPPNILFTFPVHTCPHF